MIKNLKSKSLFTATVMAAAMAAVIAALTAHAGSGEKCYGVAKAGKNDCATTTSSCAGTFIKDSQKDAWLLVPKGTCDKLTGGSKTSK